MTQNLLSRSFTAEDHAAFDNALDTLRPRLHRLQRLTNRADHAETAFGSDVKSAADEGYTLLRVANRSAALDALRDAMLPAWAATPAANAARRPPGAEPPPGCLQGWNPT